MWSTSTPSVTILFDYLMQVTTNNAYDCEAPKGTSLCETTSFDVFCIKVNAGILAVGKRKNP